MRGQQAKVRQGGSLASIVFLMVGAVKGQACIQSTVMGPPMCARRWASPGRGCKSRDSHGVGEHPGPAGGDPD